AAVPMLVAGSGIEFEDWRTRPQGCSRDLAALRSEALSYLGLSRRSRVVDELEDLSEFDTRAHSVQAGHLIQQVIGEELARCLFRVPDVYVPRLLVILGEREELVPKTRHSLERALRLRRDLAHHTFIEHVGVECDEHSNHPCLLPTRGEP